MLEKGKRLIAFVQLFSSTAYAAEDTATAEPEEQNKDPPFPISRM